MVSYERTKMKEISHLQIDSCKLLGSLDFRAQHYLLFNNKQTLTILSTPVTLYACPIIKPLANFASR